VELREVQRLQSGLLQFLIILIMIFLGLIMVISYRKIGGATIPILALVSLGACLYAAIRDRKLRRLQEQLIHEYVAAEKKTKSLGETLDDERGKAQELDMRLQEVAQLYRAISKVNAVVDHDRVLPAVVDAALELSGSECGSLMLFDRSRDNLVVACAKGLDENVVDGAKHAIGDGVSGWVAQHGEPIRLEGDASDDPRFANTVRRSDGVDLSIVVPLGYRGVTLGVLNLGNRSTGADKPQVTELDLRLVTLYAQHASIAVRNAQLEGAVNAAA